MKKLFYSLCLLLIIFSTACNDDNEQEATGSIELVFKGKYQGLPLVLGQNYTYFDGSRFLLTRSDFYMSDIKLRKSGSIQNLRDVDYIALLEHHTTAEKANAGYALKIFDNIPVGEYQSFEFGLGLNPSQNKSTPKDYNANHPLGEGSRYWAGWNSYVFSKTEGVYEKDGQQINFTYHSGFDNALRNIVLNQNISIKENETLRIEIELEHQALFGQQSNFMDIKSNPQIHNTSSILDQFMDRFAQAFDMK